MSEPSASSEPREGVYSRRVSFNEKLYLAEETFTPGFCIQLVIEASQNGESGREAVAPLSAEALASAVARAAEANPGSRLVLRGVLGWARWVAEGPVPPVRVISDLRDGNDSRDGSDWAAEGSPPELGRPLPFDVGPTCEVVLVRASPRAPMRIVFRCFHGVMDGRGLLHFAEEVFRALRGEALVGSPCTQNDTEIVTAMVGKKKRPFLKSDCPLIHPPPSREERQSASPSALRGVVWKEVVLEGAIPGLVAKVSAFLARRAEENTVARTRIMIPVDLRNYKRDLQSVGNMSYPLFIDVSKTQTWSDIQRSILKRLAAKEPMRLDPFEGFLPWLPLWLFGIIYLLWIGAQRRSGEYPFSALVTHLALQTIAPLRCEGFEAGTPYFLPPESDFVPLTISAVTSSSSAKLVVSAPRSLMAAPALVRLCDALRAALTSPPSPP